MIEILHSEMSPYRMQLFEKIKQYHNIKITFVKERSDKRKWSVKETANFPYEVIEEGENEYENETRNNTRLRIIDCAPSILNYSIKWAYKSHIKGIPYISWSSYIEDIYTTKMKNVYHQTIHWRLESLIHKNADSIVTYGNRTKENVHKLGINKGIIYSGTQGVGVPEARQNISTGQFTLLFVGRLSERKGISDLLKSVDELDANVSVNVLGGGPLMGHLMNKYGSREWLSLLGYQESDEKWRQFRKADCLVLPSYGDSWGLVINEAMAFGLPVITTFNVGASELVTTNGFLYCPGDKRMLSDIISELSSNQRLVERLGQRSVNKYENNTLDSAVETFNKAIDESNA